MNLENDPIAAFLKSIFPFNLLTDGDLQQITPLFERVTVASGMEIFQTDNPVDGIYFIVSGEVAISSNHGKNKLSKNVLTTGDHFGEDSIGRYEFRKYSATAQSRVIYLKLSKKNIRFISATFPKIDNAFKLFLQTHQTTRKISFPWCTPDESVQLISRRHIYFLYLRIFLILGCGLLVFTLFLYFSFISKAPTLFLALSILSLGAGIAFAGWAALEWTNDYLIITSERVLIQKQLIGFFESRQESPLSAILSTGLESTIWGRVIGFGSVSVRSYTGSLVANHLPSPEMIFELLENHRQRVILESHQEEQIGMRETLEERLASKATQKIKTKAAEKKNPILSAYQTGTISDFLARFFNLRYEKDGSIVYHTHWWILLRKTFFPALFLVAIVITVLLRVIGVLSSIPESFVFGAALGLSIAGWGWWFYQYQDWHNDIYIVTNDQLIDVYRKPLGTEERRSAPIKNIQTVEFVRKGLIGIILNFGTVRIQIGNEELTFDDVYNPSFVQSEIFYRFKEFGESIKQKDQQRLADWIKTYDDIKHPNDSGTAPTQDSENE